jgi:hypothetical protein
LALTAKSSDTTIVNKPLWIFDKVRDGVDVARAFPLRLGRIVRYMATGGRRHPARVVGNIAGSTADLRVLGTSTTRTAVARGGRGTAGTWRP